MAVQQLHHVAYRCNDAKQTADFYIDILGLKYYAAVSEDTTMLRVAVALADLNVICTPSTTSVGELLSRSVICGLLSAALILSAFTSSLKIRSSLILLKKGIMSLTA